MQEKHMTYAGSGVDINKLEAIKSGDVVRTLDIHRAHVRGVMNKLRETLRKQLRASTG